MIASALDLSKVLTEQAKNSGFAKAAIVVILDHNGGLHKTEFGMNLELPPVEKEAEVEKTPEPEPAKE